MSWVTKLCFGILTLSLLNLMQVAAQAGQQNFACGGSSFTDASTGTRWENDTSIVSTGTPATLNATVAGGYFVGQWKTLRYFPDQTATKFCFEVSVMTDTPYFVRGQFLHGGYDGTLLNSTNPIIFGIEIDTIFLQRLIFSNSSQTNIAFTFILSTKSALMSVCLVREVGTPFINSLELKQYQADMYELCKEGRVLTVAGRADQGSLKQYRYPVDPYDRTWNPTVNVNNDTVRIYINSSVANAVDVNGYPKGWNRPAGAAMLNAITCTPPCNLTFRSAGFLHNVTETQNFMVLLYLSELDPTAQVGDRVFNIYMNGTLVLQNVDILNNTISSNQGYQITLYVPDGWGPNQEFFYTLQSAPGSRLGPLINAHEALGYTRKIARGTSSSASKLTIPLVVVGISVVFIIILVLGFALWRRGSKNSIRRRNRKPPPRLHYAGDSGEHGTYKEVKCYSVEEVVAMTKDWKHELGRGGFGTVYLGELPQDEKSVQKEPQKVALKKLSTTSQQGNVEFLNEVDLLSRVHHSKLVCLLGYCEGPPQVLIYEYVEEGTLDQWLYGLRAGNPHFDWNRRLHVALDAALGLEYLHTGAKPNIIHRDVKTSNILLTKNWEGRVADFGLSKTGTDTEDKGHISTVVKGTIGYLDPEYYGSAQLTNKSDVYSFGVVLLEMVTGRKPLDTTVENSKYRNVVKYVELNYPDNIEVILDPRLKKNYNLESICKVIDVALSSLANAGVDRPSMCDVVTEIRTAIKLQNGDLLSPAHSSLVGILQHGNRGGYGSSSEFTSSLMSKPESGQYVSSWTTHNSIDSGVFVEGHRSSGLSPR